MNCFIKQKAARMLKFYSSIMALSFTFYACADCEIDESLKNKVCSSDYFTAKNLKQLNQYLQYGEFKDGKLLNLEINFDIKDKEINIGTTCDLKLKSDSNLYAGQNGICLQAKNIFISKQSSLFAEKKAQIIVIADNSIKIRRTNIQTSGDINISTKIFDPFLNEILISKDSHISSDRLIINTPSSLIINDDSRIKSSNIVLNGGNCEIGNNEDQDNDDNRDRERQCRSFKPKFTYSGSCLNNPIPTSLKISSVVDMSNSLKLKYSISGAPLGTSLIWKFDDEVKSTSASIEQSFTYPGKHFAEAVVHTSNGYFRKIGLYTNVSPTRLNKRQIAIFQFHGLKKVPMKVMAIAGLRKFTISNSEQNPELFFGEIPDDTEGNKLISIPELGYKGSFNLVVLPTISNPEAYISSRINDALESINSINTTNQGAINVNNSLVSLLNELKTKVEILSVSDKQQLAYFIQANLNYTNSDYVNINNSDKKFSSLLNLLFAEAHADYLSTLLDLTGLTSLKNYVLANVRLGFSVGILGVSGLTAATLCKTIACKIGFGLIFAASVVSLQAAELEEINRIGDAHLPKVDTLTGQVIGQANNNSMINIRLSGTFIPIDTLPLNPTPIVLEAVEKARVTNISVGIANNYCS